MAGILLFLLIIPSNSLAEPNGTIQPVISAPPENAGLTGIQEVQAPSSDSTIHDTGLLSCPTCSKDEFLACGAVSPGGDRDDTSDNFLPDGLTPEEQPPEQEHAPGEPHVPENEPVEQQTMSGETVPKLPLAASATIVPGTLIHEEPVSGSATPLEEMRSLPIQDSGIPAADLIVQNTSPFEPGLEGSGSINLMLADPPLNEGNLSGTVSSGFWEINTSGSYFLDISGQSFETENPFAIWIHASSVVLDGMGKSLIGKDTTYSSGILVDKLSMGVQIYNLTVEHWDNGIFMDFSAPGVIDNIISGVTAENNNNGIVLVNSDDTTIQGCKIQNNRDNGVIFINADNNAVTDCSVRNNQGNGIYLEYSDNVLIYRNQIAGNHLAGIAVQNKTYPSDIVKILSNRIDLNQKGVVINGSLVDIIGSNRIEANGIGLEVLDDSGNLIYDNYFIDNTDSGISLSNSYNGWIFNNYFNNRNNVVLGPGNRFTDWNVTLKDGPNIIGGPFLGGNYWAQPSGDGYSQTCPDLNQDGICDVPYILGPGNRDNNPLTTIRQVPPTPGKDTWDFLTIPMNRSFLSPDDGTITVSGIPTVLSPGESFTPVFTACNTGKNSWTSSSVLITGYDEAPLFGPFKIRIPVDTVISPGENWKSSLSLTAPGQPGSYRLRYGLTRILHDKQDGELPIPFGRQVDVFVRVMPLKYSPVPTVPKIVSNKGQSIPDTALWADPLQQQKGILSSEDQKSQGMSFFATKKTGTEFSLAVKKRSGTVQEFLR